MARKPKVEAPLTAITVMQHRGTTEVTSCPLCQAEPGERCSVNGSLVDVVHELRFLALPAGSSIRRGLGVYAPEKGSLLPFAAGALEASLAAIRQKRGGNVATDEQNDRCTCRSASFQTAWVLGNGEETGDPRRLSEATQEIRRCLECGARKGEPAALVGSAEAPATADSTAWREELVDVADLVFDPEFQIRTKKVNPDTVEDYAEKMRAGAVFPKIRVVRIDGRPNVVDGWQRGHAAKTAEVSQLLADVRDGTRRDAKRIAIGVNADHGLQRTTADKRAAVLEILCDHEWCALSSREAGEMANVSHEYVNKLRRHYSALVGIPLTEDRIADADGVLPARYEAHAAGTEWLRAFAHKARAAKNLRGVAALHGDAYGPALEILKIRIADLASTEWPWAEDRNSMGGLDLARMEARAKKLDSLDDIARALAAWECPIPLELLNIWRRVRNLGRVDKYSLGSIKDACKGRPGLLKLVAARAKELEDAARAKDEQDPDKLVRRLVEGDLAELLSAILAATEPAEIRRLVAYQGSMPAAGVQALRSRLAELDLGSDCPDPGCAGFSMKSGEWCPICREYPWGVEQRVTKTREHAGRLLRAGVPIRAGDVVIDGQALEVLAELRALARLDPDAVADWIGGLSAESPRQVLAGWLFRAEPAQPAQPAQPAEVKAESELEHLAEGDEEGATEGGAA